MPPLVVGHQGSSEGVAPGSLDDDRELERRLADPRLRVVITNRPRRALESRDALSRRGSR